MMLRYLGEIELGGRIERACHDVIASRQHVTFDLGGTATTPNLPRQSSTDSSLQMHSAGSGLRCLREISFTLSTRLLYFSSPPRKSVVIHVLTISRARAEPMIFPPMQRTFVSECDRARPGTERILTNRRIDAAILLAINGAPVADTIDEDAPINASFADCKRSWIDVVGQIDSGLAGGSEILNGMPFALQDRRLISSLSEKPA